MSKAAGAKKPSESQKATAFQASKAARDREDEFYDQTRKEGNRGDLSCGRSISEIQSLLWTKLAVARRILITEESGSKHLVKKLSEIQWPAAGSASCKKYGEFPFGKVFGLTWGQLVLARRPLFATFQASVGRMASSSSSLSRRSRWLSRTKCRSSQCFPWKRSRRGR